MCLPKQSSRRSLKAHFHAATFADDLVLLDSQSGHYDLFAGAGAGVTVLTATHQIEIDDLDLATELAALGLFDAENAGRGARPFIKPARSLCRNPIQPIGLRERIWVALGWGQMLRHYYGRPFHALMASARQTSSGRPSPPATEAEISHRARVFEQLWIWTPFAGDCLFRCFMLLRLLGDAARDVDWVFGVRTWPFLAHCWLQSKDLVLTDDAERVSLFAPIMVI